MHKALRLVLDGRCAGRAGFSQAIDPHIRINKTRRERVGEEILVRAVILVGTNHEYFIVYLNYQ